MNSKFKKIGALIIIAIFVIVSLTYYENATRPSGINNEIACYTSWGKPLPGLFPMTTLKNSSFLGNNINVGYIMSVCPIFHYVNLSNICEVNSTRGCMESSTFCMTTLTSVHWPFSDPVVTILNTSISVNNTIFRNGTDKNDNLGPYWTYSVSNNNYRSYFCIYEKGDYHDSNNSAYKLPISSILNPGNYTFYENITYTITLSMGFMHFTSQPFHLDESWWEVYEYNLTQNGKIY